MMRITDLMIEDVVIEVDGYHYKAVRTSGGSRVGCMQCDRHKYYKPGLQDKIQCKDFQDACRAVLPGVGSICGISSGALIYWKRIDSMYEDLKKVKEMDDE
jgi:hypothetical protein